MLLAATFPHLPSSKFTLATGYIFLLHRQRICISYSYVNEWLWICFNKVKYNINRLLIKQYRLLSISTLLSLLLQTVAYRHFKCRDFIWIFKTLMKILNSTFTVLVPAELDWKYFHSVMSLHWRSFWEQPVLLHLLCSMIHYIVLNKAIMTGKNIQTNESSVC